jgi:hypothetical protein
MAGDWSTGKMTRMKTLALAAAMTLACLPAAHAQTVSFPFQIAEIRRGDKTFCEVVIQAVEKDASVEGYALVVGINSRHSTKKMREGILKDAAAKGVELCKVVSGKVNEDPSGGKAIWEMIGMQDKPEGTCAVELPSDTTFKGSVKVKAQLIALSGGKWIEKSRLVEKTLKP